MPFQTDPQAVIRRVHEASSTHDLDAPIGCFADDYQSEQPAHPARQFAGDQQVRQNWSRMVGAVPDIRGDLLDHAVVGAEVWAESHWHGTHLDGTPFNMRGVIVFTVRDGRIALARIYMEPVREVDPGIDAAVGELAKSS